jgi:hypothetical protein
LLLEAARYLLIKEWDSLNYRASGLVQLTVVEVFRELDFICKLKLS